jgi:uncharacterized membrane protein
MNANDSKSPAPAIRSAINLATVIYALQAATFAIGVTFFLAPAVIYFTRGKVAGTWVESHLRWQLNTFWFGLAGAAAAFFLLPSLPGLMLLAATLMWVAFRIVQGWSRLGRHQAMPQAGL